MTMGPPQAEFALRECLAMGVDHAILITDPMFAYSDTLQTTAETCTRQAAPAIGSTDVRRTNIISSLITTMRG